MADQSSKYDKLRELLGKETYPLEFRLKLIGKNTPQFHAGVTLFETHRAGLSREDAKLSAQGNHASMTYVFTAPSADVIVAAFERAAKIDDILMVI